MLKKINNIDIPFQNAFHQVKRNDKLEMLKMTCTKEYWIVFV